MHDPRLERLAEILVDHSCEVAEGEKVLIEAFDLPERNRKFRQKNPNNKNVYIGIKSVLRPFLIS